jgi:hypothetical protein
MDLLNNKYSRDDLKAVFCEDLSMNCDESENMNDVSIILDDGFLLSAYKNAPKSKFTKIEKVSSNNYNIYVDDITGNISFVLYKKLLNQNNQNNKILFAKIYREGFKNKNEDNDDDNILTFFKIFPYENQYIITLDKILINTLTKNNSIIQRAIKYNLNYNKKDTLILEYSNSNDLINLNKIQLNIITNKIYLKSPEFYEKFYDKKEIQI